MRSGGKLGTAADSTGTRRKMSAAGRKAIAEAQGRRWAEKRANSATPAKAAKPARKKRVLSAEGKANIVTALRKRWAAKRAASKK